MADTKWTVPQLEAINHTENSMIVSAAAGSGKTAVLVERVIRLLDKTDIDKMLVVTFTNAAATGMKQRIHKAILDRLENPASDQEIQHFSRQLSLLHNANINTLHAFCSKFVREHFDALHLSPSVKLGDTSKLNMMLSDAISMSVEEAYESGDEDFLLFAKEIVTKPKDDIISEIISSIYPFLMSLPDPEKWLFDAVSLYENENADALLSAPVFVKGLKYKLQHALNIAKKNLDKVLGNSDYEYALSYFETDFEYAKRLCDAFSDNKFTALEEEIENLPKRKSVLLKNGAKTDEIYEFLGALREPYKKALKTIFDSVAEVNSHAITEMMKLQTPAVKAISKLTLRAMEIYNNEKLQKEMLDFNDLEHLTLKLSYEGDEKSQLAKEVSKQFEFIVVDEYQDINPVQEAIITAISNDENNLFMVGDIKQGIYGFRNTVSDIFSDKVERYSKGDGGKCVYLSDNFRSRASVLDFANVIFSQLMSPTLGGSFYTDVEALHKKGSFPETDEGAEVYVLTDEEFKKDSIKAEALFCAKKIQEMIDKKFQVTGKDGNLRDIGYGDIAILLRATKGIAIPFCETLSSCGVPVYCDALSDNFLDTMEIRSLISFLKAFLNPLEDTHLLSCFTSPIFGTPSYDLVVKIKLVDKKATLYECMKKFPETEDGYKKVKWFLDFLKHWQKKAESLSPERLISDFLAETGFMEHMEALKGGEQRISNIRYFLSLASSNYPGAETGGLYSFLKYIDKHNKTKTGLLSPKILPDNSELVQVTTIHKSKGLEYPVVILPRTGHPIKPQKNNESINFHREFGIGLPYKNATLSLKLASPVFKIIKTIKNSEELSEELRVLYVALTRAIDKTIVIGYPENIKNTLEYAKLSDNFDEISLPEGVVAGGKTYLDFILCALNRKELLPDGLKVSVNFVDKIDAFEHEEKDEISLTPKEPSEAVDSRLSYEYPYLHLSEIFSKVSVTELKRIVNENDENAFKPFVSVRPSVSFDDKKSALKAGTITHYILENTDFSKRDVESTVNKMLESGRLTNEELSLAKLDKINDFLNSATCDMLRGADKIYKELPFNIHIDGKALNENAEGEKIQLQGTIDCLAEFKDSILILDFKTDNVTNKTYKQRVEVYKPQLEYYKMGAEKLFPDKEIFTSIYFLEINHEERL